MQSPSELARQEEPEPADVRAEAIRDRCEAVTPGSWSALTFNDVDWYVWADEIQFNVTTLRHTVPNDGDGDEEHEHVLAKRDAVFIARAREDVPWLLGERDRLKAENDQLRTRNAALDKIAEVCFARVLYEIEHDTKLDALRVQVEKCLAKLSESKEPPLCP